MKIIKEKFHLNLLLWTTVFLFSLGGNIISSPPTISSAQTVYITRTGSKYHTHKCGNGTYYPSSLNEAKSMGLTPCKKCFGSSSGYSNSTSTSKNNHSKPKKTVKAIKINKTSLNLIKGQTSKLKIKYAKKKVRWKSSKKSVVSVSSSGRIKARKKGTATVTASVGNQRKRCRVKVETPRLNTSSVNLKVSSSCKIKLLGCNHSAKWTSSNTYVAKVKSGKITAKNNGTATITAKVHGKKYKCKVSVKKPLVSDVTLQQNYVHMNYHEEYLLSVNVSPSSAADYYYVSVKSTDNNIVNASMYYDDTILLESGGKAGKATVYISVGNITRECKVEVGSSAISSLTLDKTNITLKPNASNTLFFTIDPSDADDYYDVVWSSSNEKVVTVSGRGYYSSYADISAKGEGKADVTVTIGNKSATCHITVAKPKINTLKLDKTTITLKPNASNTLFFTIDPSDADDYYDVVWSSSNEKVVTVSGRGYYSSYADISAKGEGEADVTVTIGNKSATCHVTVAKPQINTLKLDKTTITLKPNASNTLFFTINPSDADDYYDVIWSSSNEKVVTVSGRGYYSSYADISAKGEGEADVTVTIGNKSATCHVTVAKPQINALTLDKTTITLKPNASNTLFFTINPSDADDYYDVIWSSSNEKVVTVSGRGYYSSYADISAKGEGEADVTVTIGNKSATCHVTVAKPQINTLTLDKTTITLKPNASNTLSFTINPSDADDYYDVIWSSSNEQVVTVSGRGYYSSYADISANGEGKADVTVTVGNKSATCHVVVQKQ